MPARKPSDVVQVALRIREGLHLRIVKEAKKKNITMNDELANRLQASFDAKVVKSLEDVAADMVSRVRKQLEAAE